MSIEDQNYYNDHRVRASEERGLLRKINEAKMVGFVDLDEEEIQVPIVFVVCETCDGKGRHVNPSIDSQGLTREDFEDEDFAEDYRSGMYDVSCYGCGGKRVTPVIAMEQLPEELRKRIEDEEQAERDFHAIQRAERAMGA